MRVMKNKNLWCVIIGAVLCASVAQAVPTEILPASSLYEGTSYFSEPSANGMLYGRVDFAVYDTEGPNGNEYGSNPGSGRYIYAYQVFSAPSSTTALLGFEIFRGDGTAINGIDTIDAHDDSAGGVEPTPNHGHPSGDMTKGIWEFDNGLLIANEHSWFLVFSSNYSYTTGHYEVKTVSDDNEIPISSPEPASLALIGLGSLFISARKRK